MTQALEQMNQDLFSLYPTVLTELFSSAKEKNPLHYALSLHPEVKGFIDPESSTLIEGCRMLEERLLYLASDSTEAEHQNKIYFALALYSHLAGVSSFYQVYQNFLNILAGENFKKKPFSKATSKQQLQHLFEQSSEMGLDDLAHCFNTLIYPPLLSAYQCGDYLFSSKGIVLHCSDANEKELLSYEDFQMYLERLINFFVMTKRKIDAEIAAFSEAHAVTGKLSNKHKTSRWQICYNPENKHFQVLKVAEVNQAAIN